MDILSKIPSLSKSPEEAAEIDEAQAKRDRIKFHRDNVRNGPAKFRHVTAGQERRARTRALARQTKKARRAQIRNHHETQRLAATVRGQLLLAGVLPYADSRTPEPVAQVKAVVWIVQRFGVEAEDGSASLLAEDVIAALNAALKFYGQAVGLPGLRIPDGYVLPLYRVAEEA